VKSNYDVCEARVLESEGGYTNDPHDPGGPTNWGITIFDARMYWKKDATADDVRHMPLSVAQAIYKAKYWDALNCDALPSGLDYTVFDYGVNSGIHRSGKVLRETLKLDPTDWRVTSEVLEKLQHSNVPAVIAQINHERLQFLQSLKIWATFGHGWGIRVASVEAYSQKLA
jgi:lysozyme family protein